METPALILGHQQEARAFCSMAPPPTPIFFPSRFHSKNFGFSPMFPSCSFINSFCRPKSVECGHRSAP